MYRIKYALVISSNIDRFNKLCRRNPLENMLNNRLLMEDSEWFTGETCGVISCWNYGHRLMHVLIYNIWFLSSSREHVIIKKCKVDSFEQIKILRCTLQKEVIPFTKI